MDENLSEDIMAIVDRACNEIVARLQNEISPAESVTKTEVSFAARLQERREQVQARLRQFQDAIDKSRNGKTG